MRKSIFILCCVLFSLLVFSAVNGQSDKDKKDGALNLETDTTREGDENEGGRIYEGYYNKTIVIYDYRGEASLPIPELPVGVRIDIGASGVLTYCESSILWWKKCYSELNGFEAFP